MGEVVQVLERKFGLFPARFKFNRNGSVITIDAVERCWTNMQNQQGRVSHQFRVRSGSNRYRLNEDTASGRWTAWPES
ncbi:MAG TPA: hypothetical protein G4N96_13385 [Chloroflexi bacterium]|nr:MAG: hypothetical protein B6243_10980 [Anaerolineaceae bacterium 4572_5.2]HEY86093.1 hypothetical protein [Chloroflexota bacterium]